MDRKEQEGNLVKHWAARCKMCLDHGSAVSRLIPSGVFSIENQCIKLTLKIIRLFTEKALHKLKFDLSRPLAVVMMLCHQVHRQCCWMKLYATKHATLSEHLQQRGSMP